MSAEWMTKPMAWWESGNRWQIIPDSMPVPLRTAWSDDDCGGAMKKNGYETIIDDSFSSSFSAWIEIHRHDDGHLVVELLDTNTRLSLFFVSSDAANIFMATRYLEMQRDLVRGDAFYLHNQWRAFISFVRHGHGEETISPGAWVTKDEDREARQRQRQMEREKERGAAKH